MSNRFTRISMVEYENPEAMRLSLRQYEDELAPKIMEYAEDISSFGTSKIYSSAIINFNRGR